MQLRSAFGWMWSVVWLSRFLKFMEASKSWVQEGEELFSGCVWGGHVWLPNQSIWYLLWKSEDLRAKELYLAFWPTVLISESVQIKLCEGGRPDLWDWPHKNTVYIYLFKRLQHCFNKGRWFMVQCLKYRVTVEEIQSTLLSTACLPKNLFSVLCDAQNFLFSASAFEPASDYEKFHLS